MERGGLLLCKDIAQVEHFAGCIEGTAEGCIVGTVEESQVLRMVGPEWDDVWHVGNVGGVAWASVCEGGKGRRCPAHTVILEGRVRGVGVESGWG